MSDRPDDVTAWAIVDLLIQVASPDAGEDSPERKAAWREIKRREAERVRLADALTVYADTRNWSMRDLSCVWIGPRAYQPFPDAPGVAREALES